MKDISESSAEEAAEAFAEAAAEAEDNIPEIAKPENSFFYSTDDESFDEITLEDAGSGSFDDR